MLKHQQQPQDELYKSALVTHTVIQMDWIYSDEEAAQQHIHNIYETLSDTTQHVWVVSQSETRWFFHHQMLLMILKAETKNYWKGHGHMVWYY